MNRVQQMMKVQEEIYYLVLSEKEFQCNIDEKVYLNELANLQQQLKESMCIEKTTISLVDAIKLRYDLIKINIVSGKFYGNRNADDTSFKNVQKVGFELFKKKNADYGDAFAKYGIIGVVMRIEDKLQRISTLAHSSEVSQVDEKMEDTILDLHNYSAMGLMLFDE